MQKIDKKTNVLVYGIGKSGSAAVNYLLKCRANVVITDDKPFYELRFTLEKMLELGAKFKSPRELGFSIARFQFIILSPGIDPNKPILKFAKECGIPVISDIELAYQQMNTKWIGITGTNGKTTTTSLLGDIVQKHYRKVVVAGNIGNPICQFIDNFSVYNYMILELSSYQLEHIDRFSPDIAIVLNVSEDHLERYDSIDQYIEAKQRIFRNQKESDYLIMNYDDPISRRFALNCHSKPLFYSTETIVQEGAYLKNNQICIRIDSIEHPVIGLDELPLHGKHNIGNIMAAIMAAVLAKVPLDTVKIMVKGFQPLSHRLEKIEEINGVEIYNDSKATNVDAVIKALESFGKPVVLLAGGKDKGGSYDDLIPHMEKKVKFTSLFGKDLERFEQSIKKLPHESFSNLKDATIEAWKHCKKGDILLLSPGGSSYDLYNNYEERGEAFKHIIKNLKSELNT